MDKTPKTFEEFEQTGVARGLNEYALNEIRGAYENRVPEAVPDMLETKDNWQKMEQIRLAHVYRVPEAIPDMLEVKDDWHKMEKVRLKYENNKKR